MLRVLLGIRRLTVTWKAPGGATCRHSADCAESYAPAARLKAPSIDRSVTARPHLARGSKKARKIIGPATTRWGLLGEVTPNYSEELFEWL